MTKMHGRVIRIYVLGNRGIGGGSDSFWQAFPAFSSLSFRLSASRCVPPVASASYGGEQNSFAQTACKGYAKLLRSLTHSQALYKTALSA